ncbi:HU family DNA-binding protein [Pseudodesulfovibrio tunisiensis]|uniref:HU family DNA-binding protein n=1 Tax=Pseudodesulfovibrio tunisiensis TaxID=463192 RepID=UPI002436F54A|nr:integration host factor subunit beta [Pseudodesulfovibrio tunisiensis]
MVQPHLSEGETMNKSELIKALAEKRKIHVDEATKVVGAFVDSIKEALLRGDRVEIRGFGSFKIKDYEGYVGRNPKTGDVVQVQPKKLPFFRPGKELKEYINN